MDSYRLAAILRGIGAEKVRVVSGAKVACACPLAWWTHAKGKDNSPSMVVFVEGQHGEPIYKCMSCHDTGSLREMLLFLWTRGKDTFDWIQVLEGEVEVEKAKEKSEKLMAAYDAASAPGFAPVRPVAMQTEQPKTFPTGQPFYDYKSVAQADAVESMPEDRFEPYAGSVPRYALDRGLSMETCKIWELGHDPATKRLLFPIRDRKGRLMAISGRLYVTCCVKCGGQWVQKCQMCERVESDHEDRRHDFVPQRSACEKCETFEPPKYRHSDGFKRNFMLYGEHMKDDADGRVYVVEGHIDLIRMWQFGYRPVVALLGAPGVPQIEKLIARWRRIIVVPDGLGHDGNDSGPKMGAAVKRMVADRIPVSVKKLEVGRDPGNMNAEELRELLGDPSAFKGLDKTQATVS